MNDFLDNLGAEQYQKMHQPKKVVITPETYEKMNDEFIEEGIAFRIKVPTQKEIDKWQKANLQNGVKQRTK